MNFAAASFDPRYDLVLDRVVPVRRALVWAAWTEPRHLMKWFCPRPWRTTDCEIDLRPGGIFRTVMEGPNGERFDNAGCWLHVEPQQRLAWTTAVGPGFRPQPAPVDNPANFAFTAVLTFTEVEAGTRYHVHAMHATAAEREKHAAMGFEAGWGTALDQLVEAMGREG